MKTKSSTQSKQLIYKENLKTDTPVRHTIQGYPKTLKLYQIANSPHWQMHIRFGNHTITKSSKTADLYIAEKRAKSFFN